MRKSYCVQNNITSSGGHGGGYSGGHDGGHAVTQVVTHAVTQDVTHAADQTDNSAALKIREEIKKNNRITQQEIADRLGINRRTVMRYMQKMTDIEYAGSGDHGHWEIKDH